MSTSNCSLADCNVLHVLTIGANASGTTALKGRHVRAQGAALDINIQSGPRALKGRNKRAFTLLEVILSLAILAGALAALGEVMRLADRSASTAEDETQAQILATSIMDELAAGSRELSAVQQSSLDTGDDPPWVYSVEMSATQYDELVSVRIRVEQQLEARLQPAHFELVRWMPNPDYVAPESADDSTTSSTTSTSSSTSGTSTTSSSGSQR